MVEVKKRKSGSLSTILGAILCIILIPIIVINLILLVSTYTHPDEMPGVMGIKPVIVLSGSMEPAFHAGDLIFVKQTAPAALKKGDIICYLNDGKAVTHRIVSVTTDESGKASYVTQGDANNTTDRLAVTPGQVQGVWTGMRIAGLGNFAMFMQSTTGMIVFIVCPLILFILWDFVRRRLWDKKEKARTAELEAELAAFKSKQEDKSSLNP